MQQEAPQPAHPPAQIGGWLYFFLVTSFLGCMSLALQTPRAQSTGRTLLIMLMFVSTFLPAVLVGFRSRLIFPALWIQMAVRLAVSGTNLSILWSLRVSPGPSYFNDIVNQISAIAITASWLVYFHLSRRVRETFGENIFIFVIFLARAVYLKIA